MMSRSFNLVDKPWIGVRTLEGEICELSLADVFSRSSELERLANETVTQDFAILRLLLAILYRSVERDLEGSEDPLDIWFDLWNDGHPTFEMVSEYLESWWGRFDLLDEDHPFMQVPGLATPKGEISGTKKLVADHPDGEVLFSMRSGKGLDRLTYSEAARWLVHAHAFDTSGIKSGVIGDPTAKGGKSYPIGTGWAGRLGGIFCESDSLAKTLLLNLVLCDGRQTNEVIDFDQDVPVWERGCSGPADEGRLPRGTCDLLTWQTRRVRLVDDGGSVVGVVLSNGDRLESYNLQRLETMSRWRRSRTQEAKQHKSPLYLPYQHQASRAFWRGLTTVIPRYDDQDDEVLAAGVVSWVGELSDEQLASPLDPAKRITLHAVGVSYGVQSAVISEVIDDTVGLSLYVLSRDGVLAAHVVDECLSNTDEAVMAYGTLARRLALAAGAGSDQANAAADKAKSDAYFALDAHFRTWLLAIDADTDLEDARRRWHVLALNVLMSLRGQLLEHTGSEALLGRMVKVKGNKRWVSAGGAERAFLTSVTRALPS